MPGGDGGLGGGVGAGGHVVIGVMTVAFGAGGAMRIPQPVRSAGGHGPVTA